MPTIWILVLLVVLVLALGGGGYHQWGPLGGGISVGAVLLCILVFLLLTGRL